MKSQFKPMTPARAAAFAFLATLVILCGVLACIGALTSDDEKVPGGPISRTTSVPDGGLQPTVDDGKKLNLPKPTATKGTPKVTKTSNPTKTSTPAPTKTSTPKPTKSPTPKPTVTTKPPVRTYANCTELRRDYPSGVPAGHPAYQKKMDRDNDGFACETS